MRYLGIDYGAAKTGIAIGDDQAFLASPFEIVPTKELERYIMAIVEKEEIGTIVVGVPLRMIEERPHQYNTVVSFIKQLQTYAPVPVMAADESYTTTIAGHLLQGSKNAAQDDDTAAMIMLQGFLDTERRKHGTKL